MIWAPKLEHLLCLCLAKAMQGFEIGHRYSMTCVWDYSASSPSTTPLNKTIWDQMSIFIWQSPHTSWGSCYKGCTTSREKIHLEKLETTVIQWAKCYKISQQEFWNQYQNTPHNIKFTSVKLGLMVLLYLTKQMYFLGKATWIIFWLINRSFTCCNYCAVF